MNISKLIVTQEEIRKESISRALESLKTGFLDTPIRLTRFEDGKLYVHDGHHRLLWKLHLQEKLYPREYTIANFTYKQYNEVNLDIGYITPFDPRTEVRLGDFHHFKHSAYGNIYEYINNNKHKYKKQRSMLNMMEFYEKHKHNLI